MKYERYDILELDNNKSYVVVDVVNQNNSIYLYLADENSPKEYLLVKVVKTDTEEKLMIVEDHKEFSEIVKIILEKNKELLTEIFEDKN